MPRENRVEIVEERIPYTLPYKISNILAIPHLGIVVIANDGLHCINSVGIVRHENLYRRDKTSKIIDVISLPTLYILLLIDEHLKKQAEVLETHNEALLNDLAFQIMSVIRSRYGESLH